MNTCNIPATNTYDLFSNIFIIIRNYFPALIIPLLGRKGENVLGIDRCRNRKTMLFISVL